MIISVFIFAPLLGLLLDRLLLRRLAKAPVYARIVGTIGLLVALPALIAVAGRDGRRQRPRPGTLPGNEASHPARHRCPVIGPTPADVYDLGHGVVLTSDKVAVFVVAAIAALVLWLVLRHTRGRARDARVVDRDTLAGLRGVNAARTSSVAWVLTMILAGLGGVLIAPLFIAAGHLLSRLVVLGSLAAVVLGGLRSIPIAFIGGMLLGVAQNHVAGYRGDILPDSVLNSINGLQFSVPYVLVIVLLLFFGRDRSRQAGTVADDSPRPDHREGLPRWRRLLPWTIFIVALVVYSQQWINASWLQADTFDQSVVAPEPGDGHHLLVVRGRHRTRRHGEPRGGGIRDRGRVRRRLGAHRNTGLDIPGISAHGQINFLWAAIVIGALVAAALGALIALLATRLGGVMLALGTLAAAFICASIVFDDRCRSEPQRHRLERSGRRHSTSQA